MAICLVYFQMLLSFIFRRNICIGSMSGPLSTPSLFIIFSFINAIWLIKKNKNICLVKERRKKRHSVSIFDNKSDTVCMFGGTWFTKEDWKCRCLTKSAFNLLSDKPLHSKLWVFQTWCNFFCFFVFAFWVEFQMVLAWRKEILVFLRFHLFSTFFHMRDPTAPRWNCENLGKNKDMKHRLMSYITTQLTVQIAIAASSIGSLGS
jgi:hypothetical protein